MRLLILSALTCLTHPSASVPVSHSVPNDNFIDHDLGSKFKPHSLVADSDEFYLSDLSDFLRPPTDANAKPVVGHDELSTYDDEKIETSTGTRVPSSDAITPTEQYVNQSSPVALLGTEHKLHCFFSGYPSPNPRWTHNERSIDENYADNGGFKFESFAKTIVFNVTMEKQGSYQCKFDKFRGIDRNFTVIVKRHEWPKYRPEDSPPPTAVVPFHNVTSHEQITPTEVYVNQSAPVALLGTTHKLHCFFSGYPSPNPRWTHNERIIDQNYADNGGFEFESFAKTLVFIATMDKQGNYQCKFDQFRGIDRNFTVTVEAAPYSPEVPTTIPTTSVPEKDLVTFNCSEKGIPSPMLNNTILMIISIILLVVVAGNLIFLAYACARYRSVVHRRADAQTRQMMAELLNSGAPPCYK